MQKPTKKTENNMKLTFKIDDHETTLLARDAAALVRSLDDNPFYSETYDKLAKSQSYLVREAVAHKKNISEETWNNLIIDPFYSVVESAISNHQFTNKIGVKAFFNICDQHQGFAYTLINERLDEILSNDENTEEEIETFHNFILNNKDEEVKIKYIESGLSDNKLLKKFLKDKNPALVAFTKRTMKP